MGGWQFRQHMVATVAMTRDNLFILHLLPILGLYIAHISVDMSVFASDGALNLDLFFRWCQINWFGWLIVQIIVHTHFLHGI